MTVATKSYVKAAAADVDRLGTLLAAISDLTKEADAIKGRLKASDLVEVDGNLFRATISHSFKTSYDPRKVEVLLGDKVSLVEKVSEVVTVRVVSR